MKKIGIYAGSFDPVHGGHIAFAESALLHDLDKVYFLVEPRPRRKQGVRAYEHRLAMTKIAAKNSPDIGVIQLEQAQFTPHETLPLLAARFKGSELVLLFGDDVIKHMVDHLAQWPHLEEIADSASLLIAARHHQSAELSEGIESLKQYGVRFRYSFVEPNVSDISSSKIRLALKRKQKVTGLLPEVLEYASINKLYSSRLRSEQSQDPHKRT